MTVFLMTGMSACGAKIEQTPTSLIVVEINDGHSKTDAAACLKLDIHHGDIRTVLAQSKRVGGEKWHSEHFYPPCRFTGTINYEGQNRRFSYYPTGYLSLDGIDDWFMCYECTVHPEWISFDDQG